MTARFTLDILQSVTQADQISGTTTACPVTEPVALNTDTRTIGPGQFFIPLTGEHFDGHDFIAKAFAQGAAGAFVSKSKASEHPEWQSFPNILAVDDPLQAYLQLAQYHRRHVNPNLKVVGITGSSGKTTAKEMMAAAFTPCVKHLQKSFKNHNNEIGLCQTLLALEPDTDLLLVEMAMRGLGQIELLTRYAEPDIAVVLNIGPAHIGLLGSLQAIAQAKCEIFEGLNPQIGIGVINGDDTLLCQTASDKSIAHLVKFNLAEATDIKPVPPDTMAFVYKQTPLHVYGSGLHQVSNALATLKVGEALGFSVKAMAAGLKTYQPESGRWQRIPLPAYQNAWLINDAYNANPDSMEASLQAFIQAFGQNTFKDCQGILVLAAMNELGEYSERYHRELGLLLRRELATCSAITGLFTVGDDARWIVEELQQSQQYVEHMGDTMTPEAMLQAIQARYALLDNTIILLKGSRSYQLDKLADLLQQACFKPGVSTSCPSI